jgi:hypothetical protein
MTSQQVLHKPDKNHLVRFCWNNRTHPMSFIMSSMETAPLDVELTPFLTGASTTSPPWSRHRQRYTNLRSTLSLAINISLGVALCVVCLALKERWNRRSGPPPPLDLALIDYTFHDRPDLIALNADVQSYWLREIIPKSGGFLEYKDSTSGDIAWKGVNMFHALHCLTAIRGAIVELVEDDLLNTTFFSMSDEGISARLHIGHCLDYLRQVRL